MQLPHSRKVVLGVVAAAVLAAAGGTYAATHGSDKASDRHAGLLAQRQAFLDDVAKRLKVSSADLTAAIRGAFSDRLDELVAAGKLSKAQAEAIKARMNRGDGLPFLLGPRFGMLVGPGPGPRFGMRIGPEPGPGKPFLRLRRPPFLPLPFLGPGLAGGPFAIFGAAAKYLGLTDKELRTRLAAGKSLAQIATDQGKSVDGLEAALKDAVHSELDKAAAAFDARVDKLVRSTPPHLPFGRR